MTAVRKKPECKQHLLDYIKAHVPVEEREAFANRIGTTYGHLQQIAYGHRPCSVVNAINIDRETGGAVTMEYMCPTVDWKHVHSRCGSEVETSEPVPAS